MAFSYLNFKIQQTQTAIFLMKIFLLQSYRYQLQRQMYFYYRFFINKIFTG